MGRRPVRKILYETKKEDRKKVFEFEGLSILVPEGLDTWNWHE